MSRIGKKPISIPNGVQVEKRQDNEIFVKGSKGELSFKIHPRVKVEIAEGNVTLTRSGEEKLDKSLHGLSRTIIANMIEGVTKGFSKQLEIQGVGYRAAMQGSKLVLSLGYSHPIEFNPPKGITITIDPEKKNILTVSGINKQLIGEVSAKIRSYRKPEPYKGKGIRYVGEYVPRKAGKAAAKEK
jgi:large subunit ribosomal protein L6